MARNLMVQGTMSGAGKSLLCAGLCRIFKQDGLRVAPFKSQNMALNSYVTADGLEMGRAQVMQAQACGLAPDVRMNPILLKPSSDTGSQVILNGEVVGQMSAAEYYRLKPQLVPGILQAYDSLAAEQDVIVIEGAGSPAEINLRDAGLVNMGLAELVDAPVLLVGDIDRGGVFAQLYGTVELLRPEERQRVKGLIINKFRGDINILLPGLDTLEKLCGIPVLGVVPYLSLDVDDEDSLAPGLSQRDILKPLDVAVIRFPRISNFTDFSPMESHPLLGVRYVGKVTELGMPDAVILPGTKSTLADLRWMRETGLFSAVQKLAATGVWVLGICGGYQMLGQILDDPQGSEGCGICRQSGLGLLPIQTTFDTQKTRRQVRGVVMAEPFAGASIEGYEIHMGLTTGDDPPFCQLDDERFDGCVSGNVAGTYLHGLFDSGEFTERLSQVLCQRKGLDYQAVTPVSRAEYLETQYDTLADSLRESLDMTAIYRLIGDTHGASVLG